MEPEKKSNGALVGSIIIIIILVIGGIYFWQTSLKERTAPSDMGSPYDMNDSSGISSESTSELDASLNDIDLDGVDKGI